MAWVPFFRTSGALCSNTVLAHTVFCCHGCKVHSTNEIAARPRLHAPGDLEIRADLNRVDLLSLDCGNSSSTWSSLLHVWVSSFFRVVWALLVLSSVASAQVVINEIHYHPVELPNFDVNGNPTFSGSGVPADFTDDQHEFVEIRNAGAASVDLSGWKLSGGLDFTAPAGTTLAASGFLVVAKNPTRIQDVYGLASVLGPFTGSLGNRGDTVRLEDGAGNPIDSARYQSSFPWPTSADALGAGDDFTLLDSATYQYKGRSLERVSVTALSNDPANWLASPLALGPTPGSANAVTRAIPQPVVVGFSTVQASDEAPIIGATQPVRLSCTFSGTAALSQVQVESFVDAIDGPTAYSEPRSTVAMTDLGNGQFTALLEGQTGRSVVRWRIKADRGDGLETIFPRQDDTAIVPVDVKSREAWQAYFVTPQRTSVNPIYDVFVSSSSAASVAFNGLNGLAAMNYNITGDPKRVTSAARAGLPRDLPHVPATARLWNGSVPAIFVENGQVRDAHLRYHGSRYNRSAGRNSFKLRFADTQQFRDADSVFITDKDDYFSVGHGLYLNANLPMSEVRWVDWYLNGNARMLRLEQGEYNGDLLDLYHQRMADLNPGAPKEATGELYKDVGTIDAGGEGPYDQGSGRRLLAGGPWSSLQRYEWTFTLQNHGWKGAKPIRDFFEGLWAARGDTTSSPKPNLVNLRTYLDAQLDVDALLTSLSIATWMCPWDDTTQNHFLWRRADGRWNHLLWDFDAMFGNGDTTGPNSWIYLGESGTPPAGILGNNFRGPNWFKDSFFKAYRTEYNQRLWVVNNTYLHPDNLKTLFYRNSAGSRVSYYSFINGVKAGFCEARFASVNTQTGHAANGSDFLRPAKPAPLAPVGGVTALPPQTLRASPYQHSSGNTTGGNAQAKSKWEIRLNTGDYFRPIAVVTQTNGLSSLTLPFADLAFGQTYFWRVTYFDANDHPSLTSEEASFAYGPQSSEQTLIAFNAVWKYDFTGTFTDATWAQPAFDDSAWASGPGVLAFETPASIPETIGTTLPDPRTFSPANRTIYFRRHFSISANPARLANLRLRHVIDDGCVIWINGVRIHRYFMNEQPTYAYDTFSNGGPGDGSYQFADAVSNTETWAWMDPRPWLVPGDNVIGVEVHQVSNSSSDVVMGLELTATLPATPGDVVINEVFANGPAGGDWIELKNTTGVSVDISGFGLTDDILNPTRFVFPVGSIIPAAGYRVIGCSGDRPASSTNTGFGLDSGGQRLLLTSAGSIRDVVTFGPQARNFTIGRIPDGTGTFTLNVPTLNGTNREAAAFGSVSNLRINEWMASPAHGDDWFELYNSDPNPVSLANLYLSDTPGTPKLTQIPTLSFIAGHDFADFRADGSDSGGNHVNFKLSAGGDQLLLSQDATVLDSVAFSGVLFNTSRGRLPDGATTLQDFPLTDSRGESNWKPAPVVVNEAFTHSTPPAEDALELHNPTASAMDLSGWWLSDDPRNRRKYRILDGTTLLAGAYLAFNETKLGSGAIPFQLDSAGDAVVLTAMSAGNETGLRAQVKFGPASEGVSFGRVLTGNPVGTWKPEFWPQSARTLGAANAAPLVTPVLINEIHYHPPDLDGAVDNVRDEFIELHNSTTNVVDLGGWRLKGGSDFVFSAGTPFRPGDYLVVVGFDPVRSPTHLAAFRVALGVPADVRIYGPFAPKLANDEASVEIARPDPLLPLFVNVDQVRYADYAPWFTSPDGTGPSLQRASRTVIGNDPGNWVPFTPTPGAKNANQSEITDNDGDGLPNSWEDAHAFDKFSAVDAGEDADNDGHSNYDEFIAGTDPRDAASLLAATGSPITDGFRVQFTAQAGKSYTIQFRDQLAWGGWSRLADIPTPAVAQIVTADDLTTPPERFYRVVTPIVP